MNLSHSPSTADDIERLARKRVAAKLGWLTHAAVYVLVNSFLVLVSWATGKPWAIFPLLGWGLGLGLHGLVVALSGVRVGLYERMLSTERARLASASSAGRDPW